jgi:hypothetical protein
MATIPVILDVYPAPSATGIPIGDQFTVTFDQEMDESSITTGTFIVVAPDRSILFMGAELSPLDEPGLDDEELLNSPYYGGYVQGSISFSRVDASGSPVSDDEVDYSGDGTLWRTVATFTPSGPLIPNKNYKILVAGDEDSTNLFNSGVKTRSVFDANPTSVTGTGKIVTFGGYVGTSARTYVIEILSSGSTGDATYQWWDESDPLVTYQGVTTTGKRELDNGVCIFCDPDGNFESGDTWEIVCVPTLSLANTYEWSFSTGSGSILTPPSSSSASGIDAILTNSDGDTISSFVVESIDPVGGEYGVVISVDPYAGEVIEVTFTEGSTIDVNTTTTDTVVVYSQPANGDEDLAHTGTLTYSLSVSSNILTITLDPGQLFENNIILIELDKTIADTSGSTLDEDYSSYFSTVYSPTYSSLRRVRLDLGNLITTIRDETIMLAILEASIKADALVFVTTVVNSTFRNMARKEYVTCLAELTLVKAISNDALLSDNMSKTLGDLKVSRGGAAKNLAAREQKLQECVNYWKIAVETNGNVSPDTSLTPTWSVKGAEADDAIEVSRQWEPMSSAGWRPAANTSVTGVNSRRKLRSYRDKF